MSPPFNNTLPEQVSDEPLPEEIPVSFYYSICSGTNLHHDEANIVYRMVKLHFNEDDTEILGRLIKTKIEVDLAEFLKGILSEKILTEEEILAEEGILSAEEKIEAINDFLQTNRLSVSASRSFDLYEKIMLRTLQYYRYCRGDMRPFALMFGLVAPCYDTTSYKSPLFVNNIPAINFCPKEVSCNFFDPNDPFENILREYLINPDKNFKREGIFHDEKHDNYQQSYVQTQGRKESLVDVHRDCHHMTNEIEVMLWGLTSDVCDALVTVDMELDLSNWLKKALSRGIIDRINGIFKKNKRARNRCFRKHDNLMINLLEYYHNVGGDIGPFTSLYGLIMPHHNP